MLLIVWFLSSLAFCLISLLFIPLDQCTEDECVTTKEHFGEKNQTMWVQSQSNETQKALDFKLKNQNWINTYVLLFKTMAIMTNCCLFIHMNVKEFK
jgi:hypothetical protein